MRPRDTAERAGDEDLRTSASMHELLTLPPDPHRPPQDPLSLSPFCGRANAGAGDVTYPEAGENQCWFLNG